MKFTSPSQDLVYVALDDTMGWGSTPPEMYSLMCVCYTLDDSPTTGRVSLTDRKLKPPPKTAQRLNCLNGCSDSCTLCAHTSERLNLCVCRRTPQRWGYVRPHKAFPPNWPHYLHDLAGVFVCFWAAVLISVSLGGALLFRWPQKPKLQTSRLIHQNAPLDILFRPIFSKRAHLFLSCVFFFFKFVLNSSHLWAENVAQEKESNVFEGSYSSRSSCRWTTRRLTSHFVQISFACCDTRVRLSFCSGKVAVKKEDLQKYNGKDTWFQLQPVSADSEVQVSTTHRHSRPSSIFVYVQYSNS